MYTRIESLSKQMANGGRLPAMGAGVNDHGVKDQEETSVSTYV